METILLRNGKDKGKVQTTNNYVGNENYSGMKIRRP